MGGNLDMMNNNINNIAVLTATNINGLIDTAIQGNITSVGTLTSLNLSGVLDMGSQNINNIAVLTATNINGLIDTAIQGNITSVGTLSGLTLSSHLDMGNQNINNLNVLTGIDGTFETLDVDKDQNDFTTICIRNRDLNNDTSGGLLRFCGYRDVNEDHSLAEMKAISGASDIGLARSGSLTLSTNPGLGANSYNVIERMRITKDGYVGIGTTTPSTFALEIEKGVNDTGILLTNSNNSTGCNISLNTGGDLIINNTNSADTVIIANSGVSKFRCESSVNDCLQELDMNNFNITNTNTITATTATITNLNMSSNIDLNNNDLLDSGFIEVPADTRKGVAKVYNSGTGDAFGIEQISSVQSETGNAEMRLFTSSASGSLGFGYYTGTTTFNHQAVITNGGFMGIATKTPDRNLHLEVSGSVDNFMKITNDTTGRGANNGVEFGLSAVSNVLKIINYENADTYFYTNNTLHSVIRNSGQFRTFTSSGAGSSSLITGKSNNDTTNNIFQQFYRGNTDALNLGTNEGDIRTDGSGNLAFQNASDSRLKENIIEYTTGYNKIKSLRTVEYEWIDPQKKLEVGRIVGFIAQEVKVVLPKAVSLLSGDNPNGYYGVSQSNCIPFLWSGVRKLIEDKEILETKVASLESANLSLLDLITTMNNRITALENV